MVEFFRHHWGDLAFSGAVLVLLSLLEMFLKGEFSRPKVSTVAPRRHKHETAKPIPAEKPPPTFFDIYVPTGAIERVHEKHERVDDGGHQYMSKVYSPPLNRAPWTIRAWYSEHRDAHIIDFSYDQAIVILDLFEAHVYAGEQLNPNRKVFRGNHRELFPDDKVANRILYRMSGRTREPVFLIEIRVAEFKCDFYHEPFVAEEVIEVPQPEPVVEEIDPATAAARAFDFGPIVGEYERAYERANQKVVDNPYLSADMKETLQGHLLKRYEDEITRLVGSPS